AQMRSQLNSGANSPTNQWLAQNQGNVLGAFNQLNPAQQYGMLNAGAGGAQLNQALGAGGANQGQLNSFINNASYQNADTNPYSTAAGYANTTAGQTPGMFGAGASGTGSGTAQAATPNQSATPTTLGQAASGTGGLGTIPLPSSANGYGLDVSAYQNPMAQTMQDWADKALQSTYAGAGDLLSGPAMQGISQYNQQAALNNSYAPALAAAQQQQGTGIGLDQYNQQFAYNQALNNQTIPFNEQMQLANLGLQGAQGQQGVTNLNAQLQAMLAQSMGQAQGAGTQGAAGSISSAIQQML